MKQCISTIVSVLVIMATLLFTQCVQGPTAVKEDVTHVPESVISVTVENADSLLGSNRFAVVEFYSSTCLVCANLAWTMDSLFEEFGDSVLIGANKIEDDKLWERFSISSVPTYVFFRNGVEITRRSFTESKSEVYDTLSTILDSLLALEAQPTILDTSNFDSFVSVQGRIAMVDFYSPYCPACMKMNPVVDTLAQIFDGRALIAKVNTAEDDSLSRRVGLQFVPTFIFLDSGVEFRRIVGVVPSDSLGSVLDSALSASL